MVYLNMATGGDGKQRPPTDPVPTTPVAPKKKK